MKSVAIYAALPHSAFMVIVNHATRPCGARAGALVKMDIGVRVLAVQKNTKSALQRAMCLSSIVAAGIRKAQRE